MLVEFRKAYCHTCQKERLHECMLDLGRCVACQYVIAVEPKLEDNYKGDN